MSCFDAEKSTTDPDPSSSCALVPVGMVNSNPSSIFLSAESRHGFDNSNYEYKLRKKMTYSKSPCSIYARGFMSVLPPNQLNDFMGTIYCIFNIASVVCSPLHQDVLVGGRCLQYLVEESSL